MKSEKICPCELIKMAQDMVAANWEMQSLMSDYTIIKSLVSSHLTTSGISAKVGYIENCYIKEGWISPITIVDGNGVVHKNVLGVW